MSCVSTEAVMTSVKNVCISTHVSVAVRLAGNGSSTNGSTGSETPKLSRKRPRRPESWKKNVAKAKRAKGLECVSPSTGKTVSCRSTGASCTCKKLCFQRFTTEEQSQILEAFNALASQDLQDSHLFGLIASQPIKRRRPRKASSTQR